MEQRGTVTGQVRHYRNCSSRNLFWHKHKNLISGRLRKFQKIVKEVPSIWRTWQDLQTITSYDPRRTFIQAPTESIFKILMQGPLEEDFNRISARSSQGPAQVHARTSYEDSSPGSPQELLIRTCARSCKDRSSQDLLIRTCKDLYKNLQGPLTGFHQDLHNIFSQGPLQDLGPDLRILRTCKTAPWNLYKIIKEDQRRTYQGT